MTFLMYLFWAHHIWCLWNHRPSVCINRKAH